MGLDFGVTKCDRYLSGRRSQYQPSRAISSGNGASPAMSALRQRSIASPEATVAIRRVNPESFRRLLGDEPRLLAGRQRCHYSRISISSHERADPI